ncbi:hypothetical protein GCM10011506_43740 [Marivirga lumbricoides]|uniref:Polysaccharide chain length determinant N-terminal domain-containing protein n=1 Tax=Marivirga lumbricoides TaxID=1046115 RepID=A0ABQ1N433_9BACT|nr:hypothetical protein GCM10011506_43740 [Marivirga lumbricoides]
MSEDTKNQNQTNNSDEIDLRQLFSAIGDFFKNIFIGFMMVLVAFRNATVKNIKIIFLFVVIGGIIGISLNYYLPDYYTSSLLLNSKFSTGKLTESSVDKLDQLCGERNYNQLASILGIDTATAKNLRGFYYESFVSEEQIVELEVLKEQLKSKITDEVVLEGLMEKLEDDNKSTYKIFVEVYDNSDLRSLEEPLLNYFKNGSYVSKRIEIELTNLKSNIANIEQEIEKIDSLKKLIIKNYDLFAERSRSGSNNIIMSDEKIVDPISVFNKSQQLHEEKLELQEQLYLTPSFELIDGFTVFSRPASPSLIKLGFYSCLYGLLAAYILIILIAFNKYLTRLEESRKNEVS